MVDSSLRSKKRILLITPENREIRFHRRHQFNNFIQLTMPYLAGFLDEHRFDISLVDEFNQPIPFSERFDLVAITANTPNAIHCYNIAECFREHGSHVVLGGPHVTLLPQEAQNRANTLIVGEAEETWPRFLADFLQGKALALYQALRPPSFCGLPIPRYDLIKGRHFTKGAVFATRGCPYQCRYCNLKQIYHPVFRVRPIAEVLRDIQSIPNRHFVFWDDNLFGDVDYARQLLIELIPLKRRWAAQVSIDRCQDATLLELARQSGCLYLYLGLESFSEYNLGSVAKTVNRVDQYRETIQLIHQNKISVQAGIIFGFDHDHPDVFQNTLTACETLGIDGITPSILTPFPMTPLFDDWRRQGRLQHADWTWFNSKTHVAFHPKNMTAEELFRGFTWFRKRIFSCKSIAKRMAVSRTNIRHNILLNLGYKWSL